MRQLAAELVPGIGQFEFDEQLIEPVYRELEERAVFVESQCFGYFPGYSGPDIVQDLPAAKAFADHYPTLMLAGGIWLKFSFLRLSLKQQQSLAPYHLDGDGSAGLATDSKLGKQFIIRSLINLSSKHQRKLSYLDVDPSQLKLKATGGYQQLDEAVPPRSERTLPIPPRQGNQVSGAVFFANKLLHCGMDEPAGHFVASYGTEL